MLVKKLVKRSKVKKTQTEQICIGCNELNIVVAVKIVFFIIGFLGFK